MNDDELHRRIDELVAEEHRLERAHVGQALSEAEQERLNALGVQLDRYWDLLRQRDARRRAGLDPDAAVERPGHMVEGYQQ
jgi:predicted transcriptional regulator